MQTLEFWHVLVLAIVEGLTEYLPVSSTGHLILATRAMGLESTDQIKDFTVIIQFGAILSVLALYRERFVSAFRANNVRFLIPLALAFLPAAVLGLLFNKTIDRLLGDVAVVGYSLIVGGLVLIGVDLWIKKLKSTVPHSDSSATKAPADALNLPLRTAIGVGFWQAVAMIPGVSRSGATIVGGLTLGLNRNTAAEFSFFLAVPTLTAAGLYKLLKMDVQSLEASWQLLVIGNLISFAVGMLAIKSFIAFLNRHGFIGFGIYRIIVGLAVLAALRM